MNVVYKQYVLSTDGDIIWYRIMYDDKTYSDFIIKSKKGLLSSPGMYDKFCRDIKIKNPFSEDGIREMNLRYKRLIDKYGSSSPFTDYRVPLE